MQRIKNLVTGLALALLISTGLSFAGSDLNEVGAFLVYPAVVAVGPGGNTAFETFVTITNASANDVTAHVSYINGDEDAPDYCFECDFDIPLTGNDTETLVVTFTYFGVSIESEDGTVSHACPHPFGFINVALEDGAGNTITDNVLLGSEVVVNYQYGFAYSIPAIPFQGKSSGDGDRQYEFDDKEYGKMPRIIAADFIAPDIDTNWGRVRASLALFTLNFDRQYPPQTDCSVTGYDAAENAFSRSFLFGCWTFIDMCEIHPEFCYPNLGQLPHAKDTHGWFQLNCRTDRNDDGVFDANGGVHGAIIQIAENGSVIRRPSGLFDYPGPQINGTAAWARLLYQSVTTGDAVTLLLEAPGSGLD